MAESASTVPEQLASDAIQIQERLMLSFRQHLTIDGLQKEGHEIHKKVIEDCKVIRDKLREIKSYTEGSAVGFESFSVGESLCAKTALQKLRQLLLQRIATSLTPGLKQEMLDLLNVTFGSRWQRLLLAAVVSCPWYTSTLFDCGQQAKHNQFLVVYVAKDSQFYAPVNHDVKKKEGDVFEYEGWLYAAEIFHFVQYISKGNVRFVESLFLPDSCIVYSNEQWHELIKAMTHSEVYGMSGFLEHCRGQAVGAVGRKYKKNGMVMRNTATLYEFCGSFRERPLQNLAHALIRISPRKSFGPQDNSVPMLYQLSLQLLQHASCTLTGASISVASVSDSSPVATEALTLLKKAYNQEVDPDCGIVSLKESLFKLVMQWRKDIDSQMSGFRFTDASIVRSALGDWLGRVRLNGAQIMPTLAAVEESRRPVLESLMNVIGRPVSEMPPEQIILIARAGSHLYDLATADSDADYVVVYAEPLQRVVSAVGRMSESYESRGPSKSVEFGAYEIRLLAEMLWKGSVVMLELVFADDLDYCSEAWLRLKSNQEQFLTEQAILQYFGLIKNNIVVIESEKHKGTRREQKLFYQVFHKLYCLEFFLKRQCPKIKCEGDIRDFIIGIRSSNPEDFKRDVFFKEACSRFDSIKRAFSERTRRLPEYVNYDFLLDWLMTVRGLK